MATTPNKTPDKLFFPLLVTLLSVAVLIGLSAWQLQRLSWKEKLIADYEAAQQVEPIAFATLPEAELNAQEYRRVTVSGEFLHAKELHLGGRRYYGKTGYQLLTPLQLENGEILLVNRGWVPTEFKEQSTRPTSLPEGIVTLTGMVRTPKPAGWLTPDNHPEKNFWFTADIPAMATHTGLELLPVTVEIVDAANPRDHFPAPSDGNIVMRNDHLGYALTWFSLAIAALVMFWFRFCRKSKD